MNRIITAILATTLLVACGQSEAEKQADAAYRDYLKTSITTTNLLLEQAMGEYFVPVDTEFYFELIDGAKGKKLNEIGGDIEQQLADIKKAAGLR